MLHVHIRRALWIVSRIFEWLFDENFSNAENCPPTCKSDPGAAAET